MNVNDLDKVLDMLSAAHSRKKERLLIKANAEIEAIQREDTAYYDGVYDAIKNVKALLANQEEGITDG